MTGRPSAVDWAESTWVVPETKKLIRLKPWQRAALGAMFPADGADPDFETFLLSTVKKAGKTTTNAVATTYAVLTFPAPETALVVANDMGQAQGRVFAMIAQQVRLWGWEASGRAVVTKTEILFPETGSKIQAIPCDYAGEAGGLFGITSWTETWAFVHESQVRLWEELTPIPNRRSLRILDTYAGFSSDAPVLEPIWKRAEAGERIGGDLPVFTAGKLWAYIDQGEPAQQRAWLGREAEREAYYTEQRESLRPGTYNRLHHNIWQSGEEAFITADQWDACVVSGLRRPIDKADLPTPVFVGVDAATRRDCAAVVAVTREGDRVRLIDHRIWTPTKAKPIDLEDTIEAFLLELKRRFRLPGSNVFFDPMQMERSAATLKKLGLSMERLTQYTGNLQAAGQVLYDLVIGGNLVAYDAKDLRQHVLNAVAKESARGWKLEKEKQRLKIDGAVALSFAVLAATKKLGGDVKSTPYKDIAYAMPQISRGGLTLTGSLYMDRDDRGRLVAPPGYERKTR